MQKIHSLDIVRSLFKMMADNEYSIAWDLIEDIEVNGHIVSFKRSKQWKSVVIDNGYIRIGGNTTIIARGKTYNDPLDYAMDILAEAK